MAIDAFLYFADPAGGCRPIKGECQDKVYGGPSYNALEITSYTFGIENTTTIGSASGGASSGKAVLQRFSIEKLTDSCTPDFFIGCGTGGHYKKATLVLRKSAGSQKVTFISFVFCLVFITKVEWKGDKDSESPTESIEFAYGALRIEYQPQDKDGKPKGSPKIARWNQVNNDETDEVVQMGT